MKPRYYLVIFCGFLALFLILFLVLKNNANEINWQFYIKEQVGAKSVLNVGKNLTFDENNLYFSDGKGLIHSLNKKSGKINWLRQLNDHSPFEISLDKQHLYVASFDSHVYQIDKSDGYISWSFPIPNQFWPDTEVVFDQNDSLVFFADRVGFLYALEKISGKMIWKKYFGSIETSKTFLENTIHFGFLSQEDDVIIVDHFPSKTTYYVDKKSGETNSTKRSELKVNLKEIEERFIFNNMRLDLETNVIDQPKISLLNPENIVLWSYRIENRINRKEIYQNEQRLYYLNADNTILESIYIGKEDPNKEFFTKINFILNENYAAHHPYKNSNPQVNSEENIIDLSLAINQKINRFKYLIKNFKKLSSFSVTHSIERNYVEFDLTYEENFYENVFNDVQIDALFKNKTTNQIIKIEGFYFDHNTWKVRARLEPGDWDWTIKIKTKYINKRESGSLMINDDFKESLNVVNGSFVDKNGEIFFPLGIQDVILDKSKDGNNLNNMGYAKSDIPSSKEQDFNFINFSDYLDIYQQEGKLNIFRYGPDNWAPSIWKNLSNKKNFAMDVKGNLQGDQILEELQKRDFRIMMSIFAFYPPYTSRESLLKKENRAVLEKYLDYIIARYAASVDIWELTNEAAPPLTWQNYISNYISKIDPYKHPITTSLEEPNLNNSNLLSIHLYLQKPNNNYHLLTQIEELIGKQDPKKAIIFSEFGFQGSNYFTSSADWLRKIAWISAMKNIGLISWNTGYGLYEHDLNGNIYLGPLERAYLKTLKDFLPDMTAPIHKSFQFANEGNLGIYNLRSEKYDLYYIINLKDNYQTEVNLPLSKKSSKQIEIIDPQKNIVLTRKELSPNEESLNLPQIDDDLAVKIIYI